MAKQNQKQTCPRRMHDYGPWERAESLDEWRPDRGLIGQGAIGLSCSFCGSLHPDRFMELVVQDWVVVPTDKNYKAYLGSPVTDEEKAERKRQWMDGGHGGIAAAIRELGGRDGKSGEEIRADLEAEWAKHSEWMSSKQEAKFYFQHLSEDQRREFIALLNGRKVSFAYPGYFYRIPFFITYE